ncbi:hypothetical protein [Propioniciclava tarda]|uniref:Pilus assembly protein n=1 Tax=Propioniciclava tarda TaxID=433330 RepID=A0A4Q9KHQ2_PROTD|nr:hypothetical protein [Propioniciclava tarda]TBT92132.1 hypothetical protein ET996_13510 [Propioniciclava tarda]SMO84092.1 hypothetical protein SAMN06266982_12420 [Propioniciclava tarda]
MRQAQRGMVTVELALVSVLVAGAVALGCWVLTQLFIFDQCQITANEVARQAARGDAQATQRARMDAPPGAVVVVTDAAGATTVKVRFTPVLLGVPMTSWDATAVVLNEARP